MKKTVVCLIIIASCFCMPSQALTVSGTVKQVDDSPLPGVFIWLQGNMSVYTMSGLQGEYSLSNVPEDGTLIYNMIGFYQHTEQVNGRTHIDVVMVEDGSMPIITDGYGGLRLASVMRPLLYKKGINTPSKA